MSKRKKLPDHHRPASRREATVARTVAAIVGIGGGALLLVAGLSAVAHDARKGGVMILVGIIGAGVGLGMASTTNWTRVKLDAREREGMTGSHDRDSDPEF